MRSIPVFFMAALLAAVTLLAAPAQGGPSLFEWAFNVDGTVSNISRGDPLPPAVDASGFDSDTGLGMLTATFLGAGPHYIALFVDHEIDEAINTFFNEYGAVVGIPVAGLSWEIDEPGYVFGNIYANFALGALDNTNTVLSSSPDDVSMALAWNFTLAADQMGVARFWLTEEPLVGGFYLQHTDPDSDRNVFFSSSLTIRPIPAPGAALLGLFGLLGLGCSGRRLRHETVYK